MTVRKKKKEQGPPTLKEALAGPHGEAIRIMALHRFIELGAGQWAAKKKTYPAAPLPSVDQVKEWEWLANARAWDPAPVPRDLKFDHDESGEPLVRRLRGRTTGTANVAWRLRLLVLAAAAACNMNRLAAPTSGDVAALCRAMAEMVGDEGERSPGSVTKLDEVREGGRTILKATRYPVSDLHATWTENIAKQRHAQELLELYSASAPCDDLRTAERDFFVAAPRESKVHDATNDPFWQHRLRGDELAAMQRVVDPDPTKETFAEALRKDYAAAQAALSAEVVPPDALQAPAERSLPEPRRLGEPNPDEEQAAFSLLLSIMRTADRTKDRGDIVVIREGKLMDDLQEQLKAMLSGAPPHPLRGIGDWEVAFLRGTR